MKKFFMAVIAAVVLIAGLSGCDGGVANTGHLYIIEKSSGNVISETIVETGTNHSQQLFTVKPGNGTNTITYHTSDCARPTISYDPRREYYVLTDRPMATIKMRALTPAEKAKFGRLPQLVEDPAHTRSVTGSNPVSATRKVILVAP